MYKFDVFLSYKSQDHNWVERLKNSLQLRGVRVWLDRDQIRPGDEFPEALKKGIKTSRAVALVVTPESLSSEWVKREYDDAVELSRDGQLQLIPVVLRDAKLPEYLSTLQHVDFRDDSAFERNVDRLVWPGITGKQVGWYPVYGRYNSERWKRLFLVAEQEGIKFQEGADIDRTQWLLDLIVNDESKRLVLVFDIFEERPAEEDIWRNRARDYVTVIKKYRELTRGKTNEIVFLLYHQRDAWQRVGEVELNPQQVSRLKSYFTIHQDTPDDKEFARQLREMWHRIQRDFMVAEIRAGAV